MTEEEYEENLDFADMKVDDDIKRDVYDNFIAYVLEGKEVKYASTENKVENKPVEKTTEKTTGAPKAEVKKEEAKIETKEEAKAEEKTEADKESNPTTGVGSVAGAAVIGLAAARALKKTKRKSNRG